MRVATSASTVSGRSSASSVFSPTLASSRRKSGLPAPRSMSAATSSSVRRRSPAAASASALASSSGSGSSRSVSAGSGGVPVAAANPSSPGRLVVHASHGLRRKLRSEVAQKLRRRVVHPVDVVEDDECGRIEEVPEQRPHHAVQARTPERRIEIVHLRGGRDLDVQRRGEQRRPRHELLVDRAASRSLRTARLCSPPPFSETSSNERRKGRNG